MSDVMSYPKCLSVVVYFCIVVLLTNWDQMSAMHIIRILRCFFLASGLKINLLKSKLYGVGFTTDQVSSIAFSMRCALGALRFFHLQVAIGQNMSRISSWSSIMDRFRGRLEGLKAK